MKYTNLGRTGLKVSKICLGCMNFGSPKWRPYVMEEADSEPYFKKAIEAGINFFDTADMYSMGASEQVTGKWLRKYANLDEIVLATKVRFPMTQGPNMGGLSRKHIIQACEASLKRLGVEAIDLYQIHRFDPQTPLEETLAALNMLVQQGKVRYIGASSGPAWVFAQAMALSDKNGWARFDSMQNHYNLLYREEEREMNPLCKEEGVGIIPWSPLARGMLAGTRKSLKDRESTVRAGNDPLAAALYTQTSDWEVVEATTKVASDRGVPPAQVGLAWLLSKPEVTAPIVGVTKIKHLEDAIASVDLELSPDEIKALEKPYQPHPAMRA